MKDAYRACGACPVQVRHIPSLSLSQVCRIACGLVEPCGCKGQVIIVAGVIVQRNGTAIEVDVLL